MPLESALDCLLVGYNEPPFAHYQALVRKYGEDSEAYRDLKFSFIDVDGLKLDYVGLMNHVRNLACPLGKSSAQVFTSGEIPNLAAVYLTNFLRKRNVSAEYVNLFQSERARMTDLLALNPICVAITTTFYILNFPVTEIVQFIRERNPHTRIVVGGPLIANHARNYRDRKSNSAGNLVNLTNKTDEDNEAFEAVLKDIGADIYVIESQGELTLWQIITSIKGDRSLSTVPNLAYFDNGKLFMTHVEPENNPLDEVEIDWLNFANQPLGATIQTRTARSCAFKCAFCNYPTRAGKLALASLNTIERELDSIRALGTVGNVVFIDDTFNVPLERFKEICRLMIRKNYNFKWFSYFRCSNSDEEAIKLMAQAGCVGVFLGIESGSQTILKHMDKAATIEKYVQGMQLLREHGILSFASFIVGFPGETEATVEETFEFIRDNKPDYYRAQLWYCEPGTPIDHRRGQYATQGDGFVWSHSTMDSQTAMDRIEQMFLSITDSIWLPQWSFDFWIIPYLLGKGISLAQFGQFTRQAQNALALEIEPEPPGRKLLRQRESLNDLVAQARTWRLGETPSNNS